MRALTGRRRATALVAALAVLGLVAGACGGGRSGAGDGSTDSTAAGATTGSGSGEGVQFGDLASPCGPGSPSGAPGQGVTADSVTIAYGDDAGYQVTPGRGHEASDAVKALIDWCNEQGGINGRTVVGNYYDAKITEATNVMTEACGGNFFLVGQAWALGASAEATRLGCGLPTVPAINTGADLVNAPLAVAPIPQPVDYFNVSGAAVLARLFPTEVKKTAIMQPNFPAVIDYTQRFERTVPTVGWEFLDCTQTYPITGVSDYRPYLQRIKDCGAEAVFTTDVGSGFQNMLDAAKQIDFDPVWFNSTSVYEEQFANWNTSGNGDKVYFGNPMVPLTDVAEGSANAAYVDLVTASGGDLAYIGQQATSAFLLWATAADSCGNDLTRGCVMNALLAVEGWTAGGLSSPQAVGENMAGDCNILMKLEGSSFVQVEPTTAGEFACDPAWVVKVEPTIDSAVGLNLDANRRSTKFTAG